MFNRTCGHCAFDNRVVRLNCVCTTTSLESGVVGNQRGMRKELVVAVSETGPEIVPRLKAGGKYIVVSGTRDQIRVTLHIQLGQEDLVRALTSVDFESPGSCRRAADNNLVPSASGVDAQQVFDVHGRYVNVVRTVSGPNIDVISHGATPKVDRVSFPASLNVHVVANDHLVQDEQVLSAGGK